MKKIYLLTGIVVLLISCFLTGNCLAQSNGMMNNHTATAQTNYKNPLPLNGDGVLGNTYNKTLCGLNFVQASQKVTTRFATPAGSGLPATLSIAGMPSGACIDQAYLYFLVNGGCPTTATATITDPGGTATAYSATLIGTNTGLCWSASCISPFGPELSRTFRTNVTAAITANGTYTVDITGPSLFTNNINGITLLIMYTDPLATYQGTLILADGDLAATDGGTGLNETSSTTTGFTACAASTSATAFLIAADLQNASAGSTFAATLNGVSLTGIPKLFWNFVQTSTTVTAGQTSSAFSTIEESTTGGGDCYALSVTGLYFQTTTCACTACTGTVLPVVLLTFTGACHSERSEESVILNWQTATETNNDYFTVERTASPDPSKGGGNWEVAGIVKGAGNSSATKNYEFTDHLLLSFVEGQGEAYYRLRQTDFDGKTEIFNDKQIAVDITACATQVFPNPAGNTLNVPYASEQDGEITLQVYDVIGKLVKEKTVAALKGNNKFTLDLTTVAQGMYVLRVKNGGKENNQKFVKQ